MINLISLTLLALLNIYNYPPKTLIANANSADSTPTTNQSQINQSQPAIVKTPSNFVISTLIITGYSSTPEQTDDDPFITASGKVVRPGIVAANFLPFGTKIKIPNTFGDQVFTVEDRMAKKHSDKIDVWFPSTEEAMQFGIKTADIVILN